MAAPLFRPLAWQIGAVKLLDQTALPTHTRYLTIRTPRAMFQAIKTLAVRGAPAIGAAAAFGCLLTVWQKQQLAASALVRQLHRDAAYLATSRPTAVNLFYALERMKAAAQTFAPPKNTRASGAAFATAMLTEAQTIYTETLTHCEQIGAAGEKLLQQLYTAKPRENTRSNGSPAGAALGVLTHCNAGALAMTGALAPLYLAAKKGMAVQVFADETRPLLQGARLTAWELTQAGIAVTVICDQMAATVMAQGKIDAVLVGADRIAANGDTANKIGTYGVAVLAHHFGIPVFVAAPTTTFDFNLPRGAAIPIEERGAEEVRIFNGKTVVPHGAAVFNPAFDVTPARLIAAIITEAGVILRPTAAKIRAWRRHK